MWRVSHINGYRRVWMFPRNIRRISPWKIAQVLSLVHVKVRSGEWAGNQSLQDSFCKALEDAGLKSRGEQYDEHSGGPRTYLAQLRALGLIFLRDDGKVYLTKAGEDIANGHPPLPILRQMLLRHQYPSAYGYGRNVLINRNLKVKPFLFILKLLKHRGIGHLTNMELMVAVVFGHNHRCLALCAGKVQRLRRGASIIDIASVEDLYRPRSARADREQIERDIPHIANTFKNCLQACGMVNVEKIDRLERITFNEDIKGEYEEALAKEEEFIPYRSEEQFQRAYGSWDRIKDTRRIVEPELPAPSPQELLILSHFYRLCGSQVVSELPSDFLDEMERGYGIDRDRAGEVIEPHLASALDYYESSFLELSRGGASKATEFEMAVCNLFKHKLHFDAKHTGRLRRPTGTGGYADVFAIALDDRHCGIIDTKASSSYSLTAPDLRAMAGDYIPNYLELAGGRDLSLEFSAFVAGGFYGDVDSRLNDIKTRAGVPCSAIRAKSLLELSKLKSRREDQEFVRSVFTLGRIINERDYSD